MSELSAPAPSPGDGEHGPPREVDRWLGTPEWEMAKFLHNRLCRLRHQMDQCWGLNLPYDLNQPTLSDIQRRYIGLACGLQEAFDRDQIDLILTMIGRRLGARELPRRAVTYWHSRPCRGGS